MIAKMAGYAFGSNPPYELLDFDVAILRFTSF